MKQDETLIIANTEDRLGTIGSSISARDIVIHQGQSIVQAGHPQVLLSIHAAGEDANSDQVQCVVKIENTSSERIRIHSVRPLNPARTLLQQEVDSASSESRIDRDDLYSDLTSLLSDHLVKSSDDYRKNLAEGILETFSKLMKPRTLAKGYFYVFTNRGKLFLKSLTESQRSWSIRIRNYEHAEYCFNTFLAVPTGADVVLSQVYKAKLEQLRRINDDISSGILNDSVADVEPNAVFSRTYIYNCQRKLLSPSIYTFSFDVVYSASSKDTEQKHLSSTISAAVSPKPVALNIVALASSVLGAILKLSLDQMQNKIAEQASTVSSTQR